MATLTSAQLSKYFARINFRTAGVPPPTLATLQALHRQHVLSIPFSNLSLTSLATSAPGSSAGPGALEVEALVARLVERRRGGYCFEVRLHASAL